MSSKNQKMFVAAVLIALIFGAFLLVLALSSLSTFGSDLSTGNLNLNNLPLPSDSPFPLPSVGKITIGNVTINPQSINCSKLPRNTTIDIGSLNLTDIIRSILGNFAGNLSIGDIANFTKPVLEINGNPKTNYLRQTVASEYTGSNWVMESTDQPVAYDGSYLNQDVISYSEKDTSSITIKMADQTSGFLPVIYPTNQVSLQGSGLAYYPSQQTFYAETSFVGSYTIAFTHYQFNGDLLRSSPTASIDDSAPHLQIPNQLRGNLQQLLDQIGINSYSNSYDKILAIENYLKTNYEYSFNYQPAPQGQDPVQWFLFNEKKGGYAEFNSAFVMLLRAAGIPSRLVSGYIVQSDTESQQVFPFQSYTWAEVKFENQGWIEFDAAILSVGFDFPQITFESPSVQTLTAITSLSPSAVVGETFYVSGTVTSANGASTDGLAVVISMKTDKNQAGTVCGTTTVKDGRFSVDCKVPASYIAGDYNIVAQTIPSGVFMGSDSDPILKVQSRTELRVTNSTEPVASNPFTIQSQLVEQTSQAPIQNAQVSFDYDIQGQEKTLTSFTNASGYAIFTLTSGESGTMQYTASFNGADYFLPTSTQGTIQIQNSQTSSLPTAYMLFYIAIPVSSTGLIIAALYLRKRKKNSMQTEPQEKKITSSSIRGPLTLPHEDSKLEIVFPQIKEPFPDVWGIGEPLTIRVQGKAVSLNGSLTVGIPMVENKSFQPNGVQAVSLSASVMQKGVYRVNANYTSDSTKTEQVSRELKIVDYTEEIVEIFKNCFNEQKNSGAKIGEETTPREFQRIVQQTAKSIDNKDLDELVSLFEIADYSLSVLGREHYEKMFLASLSLKRGRLEKVVNA